MSKLADERARQAEIDAARARELEEERKEREEARRTPAFDDLAALQAAYDHIAPKIVRNFIRATMLAPVLGRVYDIGMGVTKFDTPVGEGRVLELEATPAVQVKALLGLAAMAMPTNHTLDIENPTQLPGIIALGQLQLDEARREAHGERYIESGTPPGDPMEGAHPGTASPARMTGDPNAAPLAPMEDRIAAGEFEVVEVDESREDAITGLAKAEPGAEDRPPLGPEVSKLTKAPATERARKAREILERRKAAKTAQPKARRQRPAHIHLTDIDTDAE